ncbi:MAG: pbpD [Rickettsiaceae bacterium]|jgi:penicillin-binding protein 1A|nr:pbpD [Rickettsiaceae bacterium]
MLRFLGFLCKWAIVLAVFGGVLLATIVFYYYHDLPTLENMEASNDKQVIEICYSNGDPITTLGDLYSNQVTFTEIPGHLVDAVVATEDRKFFKHKGIDLLGILRATYVNYRADKIVQGGSTITQQLAKLMFLKPERTMKRKIQEAILAWQLEKIFSKEQILTLYLNRAYFGAGNYGIANASRYYFNKPVSKLNLKESALLAGLLKAPSKLSPSNNQQLAEKRTNQVLINMVDAGYLDEANIKETKKPILYKEDKLQRLYFADYIGNQFSDYISKDGQYGNHFSVITTLDKKFQKIAEDETNAFVKKNEKKLGQSELALILMSKDGAILAMIGGKNYQKSPFNRAIHAKRQAGSAFKLFVYLTAIQEGADPEDIMEDKKVSIGGWSPENYEKKYYGQVTLKEAFAKSINSISVQLTLQLDRQQIIKNALKMGIISTIDNNDATLALGTTEVGLLELVNSYAAVANDGFAVLPYSVTAIEDDKQKILYQKESDKAYEIIDEDDIDDMKELLREVVVSGTGRIANVDTKDGKIYGKTGTSQNYRDAWFIGFNDEYVLGVWIGNDNDKPTNKITGGTLPAELFARIMKKIN